MGLYVRPPACPSLRARTCVCCWLGALLVCKQTYHRTVSQPGVEQIAVQVSVLHIGQDDNRGGVTFTLHSLQTHTCENITTQCCRQSASWPTLRTAAHFYPLLQVSLQTADQLRQHSSLFLGFFKAKWKMNLPQFWAIECFTRERLSYFL